MSSNTKPTGSPVSKPCKKRGLFLSPGTDSLSPSSKILLGNNGKAVSKKHKAMLLFRNSNASQPRVPGAKHLSFDKQETPAQPPAPSPAPASEPLKTTTKPVEKLFKVFDVAEEAASKNTTRKPAMPLSKPQHIDLENVTVAAAGLKGKRIAKKTANKKTKDAASKIGAKKKGGPLASRCVNMMQAQ